MVDFIFLFVYLCVSLNARERFACLEVGFGGFQHRVSCTVSSTYPLSFSAPFMHAVSRYSSHLSRDINSLFTCHQVFLSWTRILSALSAVRHIHYVKGTEAGLSRYGNHTFILFNFMICIICHYKTYISQSATAPDLYFDSSLRNSPLEFLTFFRHGSVFASLENFVNIDIARQFWSVVRQRVASWWNFVILLWWKNTKVVIRTLRLQFLEIHHKRSFKLNLKFFSR